MSTSLPLAPVNSTSESSRRSSWQSGSMQVWVRFLLAIVGLGMAFGAAIFSTVFRDDGNVWATVILASLSLLLAAFVGLVTVPYLARRVAFEHLRESFDYEVTGVGVGYVLVCLIIGIAALNTGNNLLYIVVAAMLSAILVSGVASAMILRRLELDVRVPPAVFAGRAARGRVVLRNPRRWLPSFSVRIVSNDKSGLHRRPKKPAMRWKWESTTFAFPFRRPPQEQWLKLPDWRLKRVAVIPDKPGIFRGMIYFPFLPARSQQMAELELKFDNRGRYREDGFSLATAFPFAFLIKRRHVRLQREILVYPRIEPTDRLLQILPRVRGEWESFVRGQGADLYRIREYMPDDSARHVDWKATAKSGALKVREFTREEQLKLCIIFDNPEEDVLSEKAYEGAVELAASVAWHFAEQDTDVSWLISGRGRYNDIHQFLAQLAVIEPRPNEQEQDSQQVWWTDLASTDREEFNVILTTRRRESLPAAFLQRSYFVSVEGLVQ